MATLFIKRGDIITSRWLAMAGLCVLAILLHGCHLGGHDEDLLFQLPGFEMPWLLHETLR